MNQIYTDEKGLITDTYLSISENDDLPSHGDLLVSSTLWFSAHDTLRNYNKGKLGVQLEPHDDPERLSADISSFDLIAINFPIFTDGRGFSAAQIFRDYYQFQGEIRATGHIILDQLTYLARCGFTSFILNRNYGLEEIEKALSAFSVHYQDRLI